MPEDAAGEVAHAVERILQNAFKRIHVDRVHREVAAGRRLLYGKAGIGLHQEALVSASQLRLASRQAYVDVESLYLQNAERSPAFIKGETARHGGLEPLRGDSEDLDVGILDGRGAGHGVTDRAANEHGPPPRLLHKKRNLPHRPA